MDIKWNLITDEMRNNPCEHGDKFPCLNELVLLNVGNDGIVLGYLKADEFSVHGCTYSWYEDWNDIKFASIDDPKVKAWVHVGVVADAIWRSRNGM